MWNDDWLMRQINALAVGIAETLVDQTHKIEEQSFDCEQLFGADPEMLSTMSPGALLVMVRGEGRVDAQRAVALGVGLASTEKGRPKAAALIDAGMAADPELATPELTALLEALDGADLH